MKKSQLILVLLFFLLASCNSPTIEEPVTSCVISFDKMRFNCGPRVLDYKQPREKVGEWLNIELNILGDIQEIPQRELVCVTTEDWLTKIKPTLKKGSDFYNDYK